MQNLIRKGERIVNKIKKLVSATLISLFAFSAVGCNMIAKTPEAIKKSTVAKVNGEKILRQDIDQNPKMAQVASQIKAQYGENYEKNSEAKEILKTQRTQLLDLLIVDKIVQQKAKELKVVTDEKKLDGEVSKQYDEVKKSYKDEKQFTEALKSAGFTEASLKELFKSQIIGEKLKENITKDVKIDDKKALEYYNSNMNRYTEKPNKIQLAHILVKSSEEGKKVKERLDKGEDFAKVAKEASTDPGSKDKGGDLGTVTYVDSGFDQKFMDGAIVLKEGQISNPVQTQFGFHVIKCIKKEEYPYKKFETVKEEIKKSILEQEKKSTYDKKIEEWKKASKITKNLSNLE